MTTESIQSSVGGSNSPSNPPATTERESDSKVYVASQWTLMWWRFRMHKLAMAGGIVTILMYLIAIFAEFLAPFPADMTNTQATYAPPQTLILFDDDGFNPHVLGYTVEVDPVALRRTFVVDPEVKIPVRLFTHGYTYKILGLFESDLHLIGPANPDDTMYIMGQTAWAEMY